MRSSRGQLAPWRSPLNRSRPGLTLVEVMVGVFLFTAMFLPAYTLFVQSRNTAFKSKLAYISVQAAREEIEDLRILTRIKPFEIEKFGHDWQPFKGNAMDRLKDTWMKGETAQPELKYPEEYGRIWTKVALKEPSKDGYVFHYVLHVRWQEKGERFNERSEREKEGFSRFDFFLVRAPRGI